MIFLEIRAQLMAINLLTEFILNFDVQFVVVLRTRYVMAQIVHIVMAFVSRSTRASCVPHTWVTSKPTHAPTPKPHASPGGHSSTNDDQFDITAAPTIIGKDAAARAKQASNMAAFIIACLAAGIAACAIRQAIAKQRRFHNPRRSNMYVDIPSDGDVHTFSKIRGSAPGAHSMDAIEMHVHGDPSL